VRVVTERLRAAETYSRRIELSEAVAYCGIVYIVALVKPFTESESAVLDWCAEQDTSFMSELIHLDDGRDFMIFVRTYGKQSFRDAVLEQERFMFLRLGMQQRTRKVAT
jgi:hypothetical protein